jgi:hypothetical protein
MAKIIERIRGIHAMEDSFCCRLVSDINAPLRNGYGGQLRLITNESAPPASWQCSVNQGNGFVLRARTPRMFVQRFFSKSLSDAGFSFGPSIAPRLDVGLQLCQLLSLSAISNVAEQFIQGARLQSVFSAIKPIPPCHFHRLRTNKLPGSPAEGSVDLIASLGTPTS